MAGYNPPTNDPINVLAARNQALEAAKNEALRAIGTQPFQATRKIQGQVEILQEQQTQLASQQNQLATLVTAMPYVTGAEKTTTGWKPSNGAVLAELSTPWPADKTRCVITANALATFALDALIAHADWPAFEIQIAGTKAGTTTMAGVHMSDYYMTGFASKTLTKSAGEIVIRVVSKTGSTVSGAYPKNTMVLGATLTFTN